MGWALLRLRAQVHQEPQETNAPRLCCPHRPGPSQRPYSTAFRTQGPGCGPEQGGLPCGSHREVSGALGTCALPPTADERSSSLWTGPLKGQQGLRASPTSRGLRQGPALRVTYRHSWPRVTFCQCPPEGAGAASMPASR